MQSAFKSPTSIHIQLIEWDLFLFTICVCNSFKLVRTPFQTVWINARKRKLKITTNKTIFDHFFLIKTTIQIYFKCCWPKKWVATICNCFKSITNYSFISGTYLTRSVFVYLITSEKKRPFRNVQMKLLHPRRVVDKKEKVNWFIISSSVKQLSLN